MRKSQKEKAESRERILAEASRMLLDRGIVKTSVADVMNAASMTHGGFYKHFASKDDLVCAAIEAAFGTALQRFDKRLETAGGEAAAKAYAEEYLSREHVANPSAGCPLPGLGSEAWRTSEGADSAFAAGTGALVDRIAQARFGSTGPDDRAAAIRELCELVGAVVIARAVGDVDLRDEVLAAARLRDRRPR